MKVSFIASTSAFIVTDHHRVARDVKNNGERSYEQLFEMISNYNKDFNQQITAAYGCHCHYMSGKSAFFFLQYSRQSN